MPGCDWCQGVIGARVVIGKVRTLPRGRPGRLRDARDAGHPGRMQTTIVVVYSRSGDAPSPVRVCSPSPCVLPACGAPDRAAVPGTIPVVASTDVYGAVVQAVGGDRVTVTSLISDPAVDPHSYEAPPAAAAAVARARLVVVNGGGYDEFAERLTPGPDATVIDVVALSGLAAPAGGDLNEHVWYSLPTMKKLAGQIAADLGAADPAGAAQFTANAAAFEARMDGLSGGSTR